MKKALLLAAVCAAMIGTNVQAKKYKIAVIPKGTTHVFWKTVHAGAVKAAQENDVEIIWQGPLVESDRAEQIKIIQNFISRKVDAICLAPLDNKAMVRPVKMAVKSKIPVIIFDSSLAWDGYTSFVATDNFQGGYLCGKLLGKCLDGKGNVIMMRYMVGSASTDEREKGFLKAMQEFKGIKLVSTNQYAGATAVTAQKKAQSLLARFRNKFDGVYCPNESSTYGMLRALEIAKLAGKVKFVGFDTSKPLIDAIKEGKLEGVAAQQAFMMGFKAVEAAVNKLNGKKVPKVIDTGVMILTKANLNDKKAQELLNPPLKKYLNE